MAICMFSINKSVLTKDVKLLTRTWVTDIIKYRQSLLSIIT